MNKLIGLEPRFKKKVKHIVTEMENHGWRIRIVWVSEQRLKTIYLVNKGVASCSSKHLSGKAVDLIDRKVGYSIKKNHQYYKDLLQLAKKRRAYLGR